MIRVQLVARTSKTSIERSPLAMTRSQEKASAIVRSIRRGTPMESSAGVIIVTFGFHDDFLSSVGDELANLPIDLTGRIV